MRTYRIYLIRHGIIKSNIDGRYVGVTDEELCEVGKTHLLKLLENNEYPNVGKVYSSSLKRCLQTANIIYPQMPVHALDGLKEYNFGEFENKTISELLHNEKYINLLKTILSKVIVKSL
ncbi:MAG: histidine phosphatase family protein [Oscillospiraceae bacterium]